MKFKKYPWPTDGATIKYVNRKTDKSERRITALHMALHRMSIRLEAVEAILGGEEE